MNRWNKLIFCTPVQIQESWRLIQWFFVGPGEKWPWSFSSWNPEICCILRINLWNNKFMNWADFLNADSDAVIFGWTDTVSFWLLNAGGPLQLYFFFYWLLIVMHLTNHQSSNLPSTLIVYEFTQRKTCYQQRKWNQRRI